MKERAIMLLALHSAKILLRRILPKTRFQTGLTFGVPINPKLPNHVGSVIIGSDQTTS